MKIILDNELPSPDHLRVELSDDTSGGLMEDMRPLLKQALLAFGFSSKTVDECFGDLEDE